MKIGMNMLLWTTFVTEEHYPTIEQLKEAGYDGVELSIVEGDEAHYRKLGTFLDDLGLRRTAVTSIFDDGNPISPDPAIRAKALDQLKWRIDMGAALGVEVIAGPYHSAFASFSGEPPTEDERARSAEVLRPAAEYAGTAGIMLTPEALNRFECYLYNTLDAISGLIQAVDHPHLQMIYDTHHAHIEEKSIERTLHKHAAHIKHVHISENDRGTPGKGQVNWKETFSMLHSIGYDGWLTIEAFSRHDPAFASGINVWRDYQDSIAEIYLDGIRFIREMWETHTP